MRNRDRPRPPPLESALREILQAIPPDGQSERLHDLRVALAIVRQEAQLLREEVTTDMRWLGLQMRDDDDTGTSNGD